MEHPKSLDEDRNLVDAINRGDTSAANRLVQKYQNRLFVCIYRILGHVQDAQDVVQDAFLCALHSMGRYKGKSQFFTWLYRIGVNAAINHQRKVTRQHTLKGQFGEHNASAWEEKGEKFQPLVLAQRGDEVEKVRRGLELLSPEYRAVLVLKEVEDMDYQTISEVLKIPIGTVRSRMHRAREELRWILEQWDRANHPTDTKGGLA